MGKLVDAKRFGTKYTVRDGKIYDPAGVQVSKKEVAADARRAANHAKANARTSNSNKQLMARASAFANRVLQGDAENARDAIRLASRKKKK